MPKNRPATDRAENEEGQGGGLAPFNAASSSKMGPGAESGSSGPSSAPHSLATSRDDEDDDEESSGKRSNGGSRTKSNQRWMKLRTTVQISSAVKKPPLKREDSFLKKFSTRHIPESQETLDTGEGEGDQSDEKNCHRRRRRPRKPQKIPSSVVNPDENFYYYWLMVLSLCVLYNLWTLIVRQSMPELQSLGPELWFSCDTFTDIIFLLDVGVQFRTGYLEQGLMVYNSNKLAGHYLKSKSFLMDLLALVPLDLLQINFGNQPMLRFPRFLKIYRVYNYYYMVESRTVYPNLWRVLNLIHILLILAHWFGCFYYLLSEYEGFHGDWVYPYRPGEYATLSRKYLGSLYWSTLTLTTIGDLPTPETTAEAVAGGGVRRSLIRRGRLSRLLQFKHNGGYIFTIVSYLIGVFIFATIVGQVGNVITNRNANRLEFERLLDGAKTYMRHHKVPGGMKRRVLRWYDYSWSRGRIQGGGDINTALGLLPDKLKTELALHVNLAVLKKVTIFQECQPEFLHDLVLKMKAYIFTPGDSICRKGEVAREMFIIADGILEVISETGRVLTTMKAGDFFGEIGILNLDGLNKRTADVRSVGYSELFSLSREDVLAAMKDYPEAQEILQSLGRKRLAEAQRVARLCRMQKAAPPSPGHDSSDNSTGKRIVDKLKSDVKGLKNVLRKSRRPGKQEECLELQPLTSKTPQLKRQTRIDESHDVNVSSEPPVSPLGAGLPLLQRLRLLKEKQDREEKRNLMDVGHVATDHHHHHHHHSLHQHHPLHYHHHHLQTQTQADVQSSSSSSAQNLPLLHRLLHMKSKADADNVIPEREAIVKEPLLPKNVIPEEAEESSLKEQDEEEEEEEEAKEIKKEEDKKVKKVTLAIEPDMSVDESASKKPWAMLKDASLKPKVPSPQKSPPQRKLQFRQNIVSLKKTTTKMYASVDDLSPEYCGLPFVKKLKILNERQKLAELERVVRSSSLDCGESMADSEFDGSLTRSHSEACAIEYSRKLAKYNKSPPSEEEEPEEVEAKTESAEDTEKVASVSEATVAATETSLSQVPEQDAPQKQPLSLPHTVTIIRPSGSKIARKKSPRPKKITDRDAECVGDLVSGIKEVIQTKFETMQTKFESHFTSLEFEIRKRDEIINQLQSRILELEGGNFSDNESNDDSTEHDASLVEDLVDDNEEHPFVRDGSVDTVLSARQRHPHRHHHHHHHHRQNSSQSSTSDSSNNHHRRSWEEHSEEETIELQDLPRSIVPHTLWKDDVAIDVEESLSDESLEASDQAGVSGIGRRSESFSDEDDNGHNNWEIQMLAEQLEANNRRKSSGCSSTGS